MRSSAPWPTRILVMGGITIDYESVGRLRQERNRLVERIKTAVCRAHSGYRLRGERPGHRPR